MRQAMIACACVAMFGLTAAKCTQSEQRAVIEDYAARNAQTADSVDIPAVVVAMPALTSPDVQVSSGCETLSMTVEAEPGTKFVLGIGSAPPYGFTIGESGTYSATYVLNWTYSRQHETYPWALDRTEPDPVRLASGSQDC